MGFESWKYSPPPLLLKPVSRGGVKSHSYYMTQILPPLPLEFFLDPPNALPQIISFDESPKIYQLKGHYRTSFFLAGWSLFLQDLINTLKKI